jgi:hypothetical protein
VIDKHGKSDLEIDETFKDQYVMLDRVDGKSEPEGLLRKEELTDSSALHMGVRQSSWSTSLSTS